MQPRTWVVDTYIYQPSRSTDLKSHQSKCIRVCFSKDEGYQPKGFRLCLSGNEGHAVTLEFCLAEASPLET